MRPTMPASAHSDLVRNLRQHAPDAFARLTAFDNAALREGDRAIPRKYVELMSIAVALTTQCSDCISGHTAAAKKEGATEEELAETIFIATALRAGAAFSHGLKAMAAFQSDVSSSSDARI